MLELFGSQNCPYTQEIREELEWQCKTFTEYDVEKDPVAYKRLVSLTGQCTIPVLVENGTVIQIGWQGRSCIVASPAKI